MDEIFYFSKNIYHDGFKYVQWKYQDEYIGFPGTTYDLKIWRLGQIANRVSAAASVHMAQNCGLCEGILVKNAMFVPAERKLKALRAVEPLSNCDA